MPWFLYHALNQLFPSGRGFSFFSLMGSNNPQVNAIEKEVVKIWELEKSQNKMINDNQIYISDLEKDINLYSKSINLNIIGTSNMVVVCKELNIKLI